MKTIRSEIKQMIQDRLAEPLESDRPTDLMDMLLDSYAAQDNPLLTYDELVSELNGIIFAGHETTANVLTWVFYLLSEHPEAAQKLDEELATVLQGRSPTMEDLPHLPYTHMVLDETMRLYPSAWISSRQAVEEDRFDNYLIPAGAKIFLNIWGMHRHPDYWEKPDSFFPEHFTPERVAARHKFAFIPFGAGPRKCIGERFAKTEAALVLAIVFPHVSLRIKEGFVPVPEADFTLQAKGGMPMHIEMREAVPA
jgi:cytochrome P450